MGWDISRLVAAALASAFVASAPAPATILSSPRDLVRIDVEPLSQCGQRLVALSGRQRYLRLESR